MFLQAQHTRDLNPSFHIHSTFPTWIDITPTFLLANVGNLESVFIDQLLKIISFI